MYIRFDILGSFVSGNHTVTVGGGNVIEIRIYNQTSVSYSGEINYRVTRIAGIFGIHFGGSGLFRKIFKRRIII